MKRLSLLAALVTVLGTASAGNVYWYQLNVSPTAGKPWKSGSTSVDYTNWSFSDSTLTNNASTTRTWTVPFPAQNYIGDGTTPLHLATWIKVWGYVSPGACVQGVANRSTGARYAATASTCNSDTSHRWIGGTQINFPVEGTSYANILVPSGGSVINTELYVHTDPI